MPNLSIDVKDAEARTQLADLEAYVETLTAVELISRTDWNALTTAQKQAKGLVGIQDYSTGYGRGQLVNGADYAAKNIYIPNSTEYKVLCEAYASIFDSSADTWGHYESVPVIYADDTKKPTYDNAEQAVSVNATNGVVAYLDLGANNTPFTAYVVMKAVSPSQWTRLLCCTDSITANHGITLVGSNIYISSIQSDTSTGVSSSDYFVGCIKYGTSETAGYVYDSANDSIIKVTKTPSAVGRNVVLGRMMTDNTGDQGNLLVRYFAVVGEAETDAVIEANIANLYREFISS